MHSRLLSSSTSAAAAAAASASASAAATTGTAATASTSAGMAAVATDSSRFLEILNYLWIPLLISLSKELNSAKAQTTILLPSVTERPQSRSCPALDPNLNYRPVIGIVSHPGDGASGRLNNASNASYIAASYVKFVESAGARVIPLIYNEPMEIINNKLSLVNGVLFTGGRAKIGLYYEVVEAIFKKILEKNDAGEHFPLLATCLGFELLTMIISKDKNILEGFNATHQASTLQFMENTNIEGTVFQRFPPDLLKKLSTDCLVMQNHRFGISPERLQENLDLCSFFKILTTSTDKDNKVYVSTVQAHQYPVTAVQWHPEDLKTRKTIGGGREAGGLYHFELLSPSFACTTAAHLSKFVVAWLILHWKS
ncbi:gamma-glutamyl hydrolase 2-like isoform X2 [Malania oleifera]|uniref:gamma-glutamyl hydrolase 2-like isoform X2 n=1 Tax=Malania oleifera TaxID=397392 RepID=UPI0025AE279F|nr:gamma-glutamyl hydrolase 2-like isoform X2 [Malania oleifera]